jgi:ornithine cyclodeaminase
LTGDRTFIRCTLADILTGDAPPRRDDDSVAVFSPFGLGVLDLAVGHFVRDMAIEHRQGLAVDSFLPRGKG